MTFAKKTNIKKNLTSIKIWGIKIDLFSLSMFIDKIQEKIDQNNIPIHITGVNPETVVHASRDEFLKQAILHSDFVNIDNNFIVLTLRLLGFKVPGRVATPDLMEGLLAFAEKKKLKVFILGAKEEVLNKAVENIKVDYPNLLLNSQHGYYSRDNESEVLNKISDFKTDILFIALPSPQKESFILKYKTELGAKVYLGVGGAIDCRGELIHRPPKFLRDNGFEGIIRSLQNPAYYGKRYLTFYPKFIKIALKSIKKYDKN